MTAAGPSPHFERSELARSEINRALAQFRLEAAAGERRAVLHASRLAARGSTADPGPTSLRIEDALTRFVSIADEFTLGLLIDLTESKLPNDARVAILWERYEERYTDSWEQRFASFEGLHKIVVHTFPRYSPLMAYIEARNAIVHGLGSLTRKQLKKPGRIVGKLRTARINMSGNRLLLTADDAVQCALVIRELIEWLDDQAAAAV